MKKKGTRRRLPKTQSHSLPHPYIFVSSKNTTYIFMQAIGCQDVVLFALPNAFITNKQTNNMSTKQRCRDGVMSDFVSWCRHLVPSFFMK